MPTDLCQIPSGCQWDSVDIVDPDIWIFSVKVNVKDMKMQRARLKFRKFW